MGLVSFSCFITRSCPSLLVMSGGCLSFCIALGAAGVCGNEVVDEFTEPQHYGSPCIYKARCCVRQVMRIPY